jgi:hypothetical protein
MKIYKAKVKYTAGSPREGQYGPSINVLVTMEDGTTQRIYGKPGDAIERLKSGQDVQLVEDKGKFKLVEVEHTIEKSGTSETPTNQKIELTEDEKLDLLLTKANKFSIIYRQIYSMLIEGELVKEEYATPAASTIFIQLMQKEK